MYRNTYIALAVVSIASAAGAAVIPLDISANFNYDAIATTGEVSTVNTTSGSTFVTQTVGDHNLKSNLAYVNQGSVPSGQTGLPDDGMLTYEGFNYQLSTNFENFSSATNTYSPAPNIIRVAASNNTASSTVTLLAGQQDTYDSINFVFSSLLGGASTYRAFVTANYADSTSAIIYDSGPTASGRFGADLNGTTTDAAFEVAYDTTYILGLSGSPSKNAIRSGATRLFTFADPLALDSTKVLQGFTLSTMSSGVNRSNNGYFFAASANQAIPEPASLSMLGALGLLGRRRR